MCRENSGHIGKIDYDSKIPWADVNPKRLVRNSSGEPEKNIYDSKFPWVTLKINGKA